MPAGGGTSADRARQRRGKTAAEIAAITKASGEAGRAARRRYNAANTSNYQPSGARYTGGGGAAPAPVSTLAGLPQSPLLTDLINSGLIKEGMPPEQSLAILQLAQMRGGVAVDIKALMDQVKADYAKYTGDTSADAANWMKQMYGTAFDPNDPNAAAFAADPLFANYAASMEQMEETAGQNEATDLAWFTKAQEADQAYYDQMMAAASAGTLLPAATGGSGGGGGGRGRGGRGYSSGGEGDLGFRDSKITVTDQERLDSRAQSNLSSQYPDWWQGLIGDIEGQFPGSVEAQQLVNDLIQKSSGPRELAGRIVDERDVNLADLARAEDIITSNQLYEGQLPAEVESDIRNYERLTGMTRGDNPETEEVEQFYSTGEVPNVLPTPEEQELITRMRPLYEQIYNPNLNPYGTVQSAEAARNYLTRNNLLSGNREISSAEDILSRMEDLNEGQGRQGGQLIASGGAGAAPAPYNPLPTADIETQIAGVPGPERSDARQRALEQMAQQRQAILQQRELAELQTNLSGPTPGSSQIPLPQSATAELLPVMTRPGDVQQTAQNAETSDWLTNSPMSDYYGSLYEQPLEQYASAQQRNQDALQASILGGGNKTGTAQPEVDRSNPLRYTDLLSGNPRNLGGADQLPNTNVGAGLEVDPITGQISLADPAAADAYANRNVADQPTDAMRAAILTNAGGGGSIFPLGGGGSGRLVSKPNFKESFDISRILNAIKTAQQQSPSQVEPGPTEHGGAGLLRARPRLSVNQPEPGPATYNAGPISFGTPWTGATHGQDVRPDILRDYRDRSYGEYLERKNAAPVPAEYTAPLGEFWQEEVPEDIVAQDEFETNVLNALEGYNTTRDPLFQLNPYRETLVDTGSEQQTIKDTASSYEDAAAELAGGPATHLLDFDEIDLMEEPDLGYKLGASNFIRKPTGKVSGGSGRRPAIRKTSGPTLSTSQALTAAAAARRLAGKPKLISKSGRKGRVIASPY